MSISLTKSILYKAEINNKLDSIIFLPRKSKSTEHCPNNSHWKLSIYCFESIGEISFRLNNLSKPVGRFSKSKFLYNKYLGFEKIIESTRGDQY